MEAERDLEAEAIERASKHAALVAQAEVDAYRRSHSVPEAVADDSGRGVTSDADTDDMA